MNNQERELAEEGNPKKESVKIRTEKSFNGQRNLNDKPLHKSRKKTSNQKQNVSCYKKMLFPFCWAWQNSNRIGRYYRVCKKLICILQCD